MFDKHDDQSSSFHAFVWPVELIISGGQTGADRAALDWAIQQHIPHAGWCPRGRKADEDLPIPSYYQLQETPSGDYAQRTAWNVRDADGTLIFSLAPDLVDGSEFTRQCAQQFHKPYLHIHPGCIHPVAQLQSFLHQHRIRVLNIAGPRQRTEPAIAEFVTSMLDQAYTAR